MNKDLMEAAARFAAARREAQHPTRSADYWEAGALTSSHEDVLEVVRQWRALEPGELAWIRDVWPRLAIALDALAEGMQRR